MRGIVVVTLVIGCGGAAAPAARGPELAARAPAPARAWSGPVRRGGIQRVAAWPRAGDFGGYAGLWRHVAEDQRETLEILGDGSFDWIIERTGQRCEIVGTVAVVPGDPPQLAWAMTINNCNQSYQGKTSNDIVVAHGLDTMSLQDAEFSELQPVDYRREGAPRARPPETTAGAAGGPRHRPVAAGSALAGVVPADEGRDVELAVALELGGQDLLHAGPGQRALALGLDQRGAVDRGRARARGQAGRLGVLRDRLVDRQLGQGALDVAQLGAVGGRPLDVDSRAPRRGGRAGARSGSRPRPGGPAAPWSAGTRG